MFWAILLNSHYPLVQQLDNATIPRTPLLQAGQTISNLAHGVYNITGGQIRVGVLGSGKVTRITGIFVDKEGNI